MSPEQALQVFEQVSNVVNGTKQDHVNIQQAIMVLRGLVMEKEAAEREAALKSAEPETNDATAETQTEEQATQENAA